MCIRDSLIGERTAEDIKIKIGSAYPYDGEGAMDVKGRNPVSYTHLDVYKRQDKFVVVGALLGNLRERVKAPPALIFVGIAVKFIPLEIRRRF